MVQCAWLNPDFAKESQNILLILVLAAIIDWHSKKILSWKLSNTMDITLVTSVLKEALVLYPKPEIFNTQIREVNIQQKHM